MRRNRNTHAALDMTPLLDVIFLVLFTVIMAYAQVATEAIVTETDQENAVQAYQNAASQYDQLLDKVELLTITCTYNKNHPSHRTLRVLSEGVEEPKYQQAFDESNKIITFKQFEDQLNDMIKEKPEKLFFISCNDENILREDKQKILAIISRTANQYPDTVRR